MALAALVLSLSGNFVTWQSKNDSIQKIEEQRAAQRREGRVRINLLIQSNCKEINKIKLKIRTDAIENRAKLEQNAKLLNIPVTPQLRKAVNRDTNKTLKKYKATDCSKLRLLIE